MALKLWFFSAFLIIAALGLSVNYTRACLHAPESPLQALTWWAGGSCE